MKGQFSPQHNFTTRSTRFIFVLSFTLEMSRHSIVGMGYEVWISIPCRYKRDRLCGLVVRVSGYTYRGPGFDPRRYQIFWVVVGLERGPLSLVRSTEELLEWKK